MASLYRACQRLRRRLADDLFLDDDLRAHARGLTVEPIHGGTGRRYRDPRFDHLHECWGCRGAGFLGIEACAGCDGRGVVDTRTTRIVGTRPDTPGEPNEGPNEGPNDEPTHRTLHVVAERVDRRLALPPDEEER